MFAHRTGRDRVMAVFGAVLVQVMLVGATVNAAAPNTSHYDFSARLALPPLIWIAGSGSLSARSHRLAAVATIILTAKRRSPNRAGS